MMARSGWRADTTAETVQIEVHLRRTWRHRREQSVDLASLDGFETIEQQQVVSSRRGPTGSRTTLHH